MIFARRHFLKSAAAVTLGFCGLHRCLESKDVIAAATNANKDVGYGPLQKDPQGVLDLPRGFTYQVISRRGESMDDGLLVPDLPDGMAAFPFPRNSSIRAANRAANHLTILVRNHELEPHQQGPFGQKNQRLLRIPAEKVYDKGFGKTPCNGGTTTVVYDVKRRQVVRQFLSLAGAMRNCAGGPTPWGSWISCEETVQRIGWDAQRRYVAEQDHGYCFEVPARDQIQLAPPQPLKAMGRLNHEAVAVDPRSGAIYQTEDREDGLIYRFLPEKRPITRPGQLASGKLQALAVSDQPSADTRNWDKNKPAFPVGKVLAVQWIDLEQIDSPNDDLRHRGFAAGAARFARGEGMWYGRDAIYFACTNGGQKKLGQIWRYTPSPVEGAAEENQQHGRLELFVEPNNSSLLEGADNICFSPSGDLMVCEDHDNQHIRLVGVTPGGRLYHLAQSRIKSEIAGSTFSPDGSTLFVNLQKAGLTLAINGKFKTTQKNR